jgi:hypothetical protein
VAQAATAAAKAEAKVEAMAPLSATKCQSLEARCALKAQAVGLPLPLDADENL